VSVIDPAMFDASLRRLVDPLLLRAARVAVRSGLTADGVTALAFVAGMASALAASQRAFGLALLLMAAGRIADGMDGLVAALTRRTDRGGYLDIVGDFAFYGALPFAFAVAEPAANALAAAFLLLTFYVNGASFLAYAAVAARRGLVSTIRGEKSIHFTAGLAEGGETIAAFAAMLLRPDWFPGLAFAFGAICLITASARVWLAWRHFQP
jgi:phosphatidylglycerophosphate synthase